MERLFVIGVQDVPEHVGAWTFPIPRSWLAATLEGSELTPGPKDGLLEVEVTRTGKDFLVRGGMRAALAGTCVRCLRPTPVRIDVPILVLFVPGPAVEVEQREEDEDAPVDKDPDVEHFVGERLVLDDYVRDTILLEIPMDPKCETDCSLPERPQGES